jgi:membrane protein YqaA with SNARE-associated domain
MIVFFMERPVLGMLIMMLAGILNIAFWLLVVLCLIKYLFGK